MEFGPNSFGPSLFISAQTLLHRWINAERLDLHPRARASLSLSLTCGPHHLRPRRVLLRADAPRATAISGQRRASRAGASNLPVPSASAHDLHDHAATPATPPHPRGRLRPRSATAAATTSTQPPPRSSPAPIKGTPGIAPPSFSQTPNPHLLPSPSAAAI